MRASFTPCSIVSTSGSPKTENVTASPWSRRRSPMSDSARCWSLPVTISARCPYCFASGASSRTQPGPNKILTAVANSKRMAITEGSPLRVIRKQVVEFHARARLGHHRRDRIAPRLVMRRFLMRGGRLFIPINLHQDESMGLVLLLDQVEPGNARFLYT